MCCNEEEQLCQLSTAHLSCHTLSFLKCQCVQGCVVFVHVVTVTVSSCTQYLSPVGSQHNIVVRNHKYQLDFPSMTSDFNYMLRLHWI